MSGTNGSGILVSSGVVVGSFFLLREASKPYLLDGASDATAKAES